MVEKTLKNKEILAYERKRKLEASFFKKGIFVALFSGIAYGLYSAFLTLGMGKGVWESWNSDGSGLSAFSKVFILAILGAGINDIISALWAILKVGTSGKFGDFVKTLKTKPGIIMVAAALIGGPIAGVAYVIALQMAGSIVIPIAALNTAVGAILGRVLFKQELNLRMILGVLICVASSFIIGLSAGGDTGDGVITGILIALIAAFGWGLEGCVAGFGTSMIDADIGITIRQVTSGVVNLFILFPLLAIIEGSGFTFATNLLGQAFSDRGSIIFFIISGFFTLYAFSLWYKGNSMCGAALGMACNGTYSFWGPLFCWIVIGLIFGLPGYDIPTVVWFAAILMAVGIFLIAVNPLDFFKKENKEV